MSAFVAFNGFPGQDVESPIGNLVLQERPAPVSVPDPVTIRTTAPSTSPTTGATHHRHASRRAEGPKTTTGLIKHRASVPTQTQTQAPAASQPSAGSSQSALPVQQTTPQLPSTQQVLPGVTLPKVQLPAIQAPDSSQQPLTNTVKAVTNLVTGGK